MKRFGLRCLPLIVLAFLLSAMQDAQAGMVFVSDSNGNVWFYHSVKQMGNQTQTKNVGKLVRDASVAGDDYKDDQDTVADLASGFIYRITGEGDIIRYNDVASYLTNTAGTQVGLDNAFSGTNAIVGASYDPNLQGLGDDGFYSVAATGSTNAGDIERYNTLTRFLNSNPNTFLTSANYTGAVFNFYDPDPTPGLTVGNEPTLPKKNINAHYYQVAGNGRLEGFESLADYNSSSNNRINITDVDAFGRNGPYQARAAFAVPAPEPASLALCFGAVCNLLAIRRR
jgi:hypothetical protein